MKNYLIEKVYLVFVDYSRVRLCFFENKGWGVILKRFWGVRGFFGVTIEFFLCFLLLCFFFIDELINIFFSYF